MTLEEECTLSYYKEIASLSEEHCVYLVQHVESHKIYVKKILKIYNAEVFYYLKNHHIPNTPQIYEVVEDQDRLIVIEEYIGGTNLQEQLDAGVTFHETQVIQMIYQLCEILIELHHATPPIIHRDIKPSNIIISPDNVLKLLDMNAAKRSSTHSAKDTVLMGTVGYAAPEQYGFGTSSMQTDIYAVGVLMNVLLTGKIPQESFAKGKLAPIIAKCTKLEPKERFFSVDDIITELEKLQNRESVSHKKKLECPYAPPGFRTLKPLRIIASCFGYYFLFWIGANLEVEPVTNNLDLWLNRIACILICLSQVFFWGNYLDMQEKMGLFRIQNQGVRLAAKIGISILLVFFFIAILVSLEMILGL